MQSRRADDANIVSAATPLNFELQREGNLAEYFLVNDADYNLFPIPKALTDEQAVYTTDMLTTGLAGAENAEIPPGGTVAIFAQGPVGLDMG